MQLLFLCWSKSLEHVHVNQTKPNTAPRHLTQGPNQSLQSKLVSNIWAKRLTSFSQSHEMGKDPIPKKMEYIFFHQRTTGISIHVFQLSVQLVYSKFLSWFFEEACQRSLLGWFVLCLCIWLLVCFLCWRRSFFVHWRIISYLNIIITCISRVAFPDFLSNYKKEWKWIRLLYLF